MKAAFVSLLMLFLLTIAGTAHAFRCPNGSLILQGDTAFEVIANCGQPAYKEFSGKQKVRGRKVIIDRYLYIPPAGSFLRVVEFHNGVVASVTLGQRVL
ncbi:MAG: DUF2845 domain-containing protein [Pseudomonadota bacterium]